MRLSATNTFRYMAKETISSCYASHPLRGELVVPGDKSISHRVAILGGLATGSMRVRNYLCSADCLNTLHAMQQLGAVVSPAVNAESFSMTGVAMHPRAPERDIDCGNSGTGMRLLAGVLSALPFSSRLVGDESLSRRPMRRIMTPLEQMGAHITPHGEKEGCAPLEITGGQLQPISYALPMASAQVKSAILLAGLFTRGETRVLQPAVTRDHTERLLRYFGAPCTESPDHLSVAVRGQVHLRARDIDVPSDFSSAAFWMVAASIVPGSEVTLRGVGLNPTRTALLGVLRRMGARIEITNERGEGEPVGDITVRYATDLHGTDVLPDEVPNLIDEVPILCVAAACAQGDTTIRQASELRVKESDRISSVVHNLQAMGAVAREYEDGMQITGGAPLVGATLDSYTDHRVAMSFLVAGLRASGQTRLLRCSNIDTSYPGFEEHMQLLVR